VSKRLAALALALTALLVAAAPASAGTASDWIRTGRSTMPLNYYQGVTSDDDGHVFFDGVFTGLYRTDTKLKEQARTLDVIDPGAKQNPGFNHIGDITFDNADGGRIILPLECYDASKNPSNTCGVGGFGVADPDTLAWKYWVKLDPADIPKAMWAETSPDGKLIWTSSGNDLLAYNTADVSRANGQPASADGPTIRPAKRVVGAVPAHGITGAVFVGARLFVAGQDGDAFRVSSIDLTTGQSRPEIKETIRGESEGLDTFRGLGGSFHWMVMPFPQGGGQPSFESDKGSLLHYKAEPTALELVVTPRSVKAGRRTRFAFRVSDDNGDPVKGATVKLLHARARTDARGRAKVTATPPKAGRFSAVATKKGLKTARAVVRSSR
jgi:hypothetical protein